MQKFTTLVPGAPPTPVVHGHGHAQGHGAHEADEAGAIASPDSFTLTARDKLALAEKILVCPMTPAPALESPAAVPDAVPRGQSTLTPASAGPNSSDEWMTREWKLTARGAGMFGGNANGVGEGDGGMGGGAGGRWWDM